MQGKGFVVRLSWGVAGLAAFGLALPVCILRSVKQRGPEFSRVELVTRPVGEFSIPDRQAPSVLGQDDRLSQSEGDREPSADSQSHVRSSDQPAGVFVAQKPSSSLPRTASGSPPPNMLSLTRPTVQTNDTAVPTGFLQGTGGDPAQRVPGNGTPIIRMQDEDAEAAGGAGGASSGPSLLTIGAGVLAAAGVTAATLAIIEANNDPASP
jgi:hypothetical protein